MARRVAPERAAAGFLRAGDPPFASALRAIVAGRSHSPAGSLAAPVRAAVDAREYRGPVRAGKKELVRRRRRGRNRGCGETGCGARRSSGGAGRARILKAWAQGLSKSSCAAYKQRERREPLASMPLAVSREPDDALVLARHLIDRPAAAADRGADERALLAADERADAGAGAARSANHERALLPRPAWARVDDLVIASRDRRSHAAHGRRASRLGCVVRRCWLIARRRCQRIAAQSTAVPCGPAVRRTLFTTACWPGSHRTSASAPPRPFS